MRDEYFSKEILKGDRMSESESLFKIRNRISDCKDPNEIVKIERLFSALAEIVNLKQKIEMIEEECQNSDVPLYYFLAQSLEPSALSFAASSASNRRKQIFRDLGIEEDSIDEAESNKKKRSKLGGLGESF